MQLRPLTFTIEVRHLSSVQFVNNKALHVGRAVYSEIQSASPCMFMVINYTAEISFVGNFAKKSSVLDITCMGRACDDAHMNNGYPYCVNKGEETINHAWPTFSLNPDLNEILSPVYPLPLGVCVSVTL